MNLSESQNKVKFMFTRAIVRTPCQAMVNGIGNADLGVPDYKKALAQHADYIAALEECGLQVKVLPPVQSFPDSTFVEDTALLTPHCAILTNPGAPTRTLETRSILIALRKFYANIEIIEAPGTVDAGDIMMVGERFYIGLSERTNRAGAQRIITILERNNMRGSVIKVTEVLHLKSGLGYLENNNLLAGGEFHATPEFRQYNLLKVDPNEAYAANSVWIN